MRGFNCHQNAQGWNRNFFFSMRKMWGGFESKLVELYLLLVSLHGIWYWSYSVLGFFYLARRVGCELWADITFLQLHPGDNPFIIVTWKVVIKGAFFGYLIPCIFILHLKKNPGIFISRFVNSFCSPERRLLQANIFLRSTPHFWVTWSQDKT